MERFSAPTIALLLLAVVAVPPAFGIGAADAPAATGPSADALASTNDGDARRATAAAPEPVNNSSARMVIPPGDLRRAGVGRQGPNLAAALARESDELRRRNDVLALRVRFDGLPDAETRRELLHRRVDELEGEALRLNRRQRSVIEAYAAGSIDESTLLRRLADVGSEADRMLYALSRIGVMAAMANAEDLRKQIDRVRARLVPLQGPVRTRVAETLAANGSLPPVYVEANRSAVTLAMVTEGTFVREAFFMDNRKFTGVREITSTTDALTKYADYYPWAVGEQGDLTFTELSEGTYRVAVAHDQGELVSYMGARTGRIFSERHHLQLSTLPTDRVATSVGDEIRVVLNRTYRGGPMRVEIYDVATGDRVGGIVSVGNRSLGATGPDGVTWFVEPRSTYSVTVRSSGTMVTLNVTAPPA